VIPPQVQVIDEVDREIFKPTVWTGGLRTLGLSIRNVTVYEDGNGPGYNRERPWDSGALLRTFSCNDWSSVCLAHLFTATDFTDGRLGVAYVASSNPQATGGICSRCKLLCS